MKTVAIITGVGWHLIHTLCMTSSCSMCCVPRTQSLQKQNMYLYKEYEVTIEHAKRFPGVNITVINVPVAPA